METKRKAKFKEIKVWYKIRPGLNIWLTTIKGKSHIRKLLDETWYDGHEFNTGYSAMIQCKLFAIHIRIKWWKLNL